MSTIVHVDQKTKLRGMKEKKQPGSKELFKKMMIFSEIKMGLQTFISKERQVLLCIGLRLNLIGTVHIF